MIIHIYSIMRNEEDILPYFLRHYSTFADTIFILNDHSTDKTVEIASAHPKVRLIDFPYDGGLNEEEHSDAFIQAYKQHSRGVADWVMCVDGDEFIYHPDILAVLKNQQRKGLRVIKVTGYNMFCESYPSTNGQIYEECFLGLRNSLYNKQIIFNPEIDLEFTQGRHRAKLPDGIEYRRCKILLLHYRYLDKASTVKRLEHPRYNISDDKMAWKRKLALERYENGLQGKLGKLEKVV